jgi:hypothetical protein
MGAKRIREDYSSRSSFSRLPWRACFADEPIPVAEITICTTRPQSLQEVPFYDDKPGLS